MTEYTTPRNDAQQEINQLLRTVRMVADTLSIIASACEDDNLERRLHSFSHQLMRDGHAVSVALRQGERS